LVWFVVRVVTSSRVLAIAVLASMTLGISRVSLSGSPSGGLRADPGADWAGYGRTFTEDHYSPLRQIDAANVAQLGLAWSLDLPGERTLEATPLAVNGVLYFSGTGGSAYAVDAITGRRLWRFDPDFAHHHPEKLRLNMGSNRGVAYWQGKVFVGAIDGRLVALDAKTGDVVWSADTFDAPDARKAITGAPRIFGNKVIIGQGGADFGTRGYVTAYDAATGKLLWRFYTVPGNPRDGFENNAMAMASRTWGGSWWHWGGGGTVWDSITYDPDLDRLYIGVGNGGPWNANIRSPGGGDNLFLCAIVALDASSGRYLWHYQTNPRESWDFKATTNMVLADLAVAGQVHKVLMQAAVNGFFYVLDRANGKLLSADKFAKVTWAEHIDLTSGRPVEIPNLRYEQGPITFWPSSAGAHNWQPMSFNPMTGLVYIPTMQLGLRIGPEADRSDLDNFDNPHRRYMPTLGAKSELVISDPQDGTAGLLAWDPVKQKKRWEVHYSDSFWNGGTMSTAGNLVFQGTGKGELAAYDARDGKKLWAFNAGLGITGSPNTYLVGGVQYVSVLVGFGGSAGNGTKLFDYGWRFNEQPRRLLTFALGAHQPLPYTAPPRFALKPVDDSSLVIDENQAAQGGALFNSTCFLCHGANAEGTGSIAPDLRESHISLDWLSFRRLLHTGALASLGMPKYDDLTEDDMRSLFLYVRKRARDSKVQGQKDKADGAL
jgi:quinohemoprotein ethanol dehydrogenase